MKAIRVHHVGGPEVLQFEDLPAPTPGPGQLLVRVIAAGVNPADTYMRSGTQGRNPTLPYTPGDDGAGIVEALGPGASGFDVGARVYFSGTAGVGAIGSYAESTVCRLDQVHVLPTALSFQRGAAIGIPYGTAYRALFDRAGARPGDVVLIHGGSGGVGLAAIQLGRAAGLTVLATAGSARGLQATDANGAHASFDHTSPDYLEAIRSAAGPHGVDVIIEMLANRNLDHDLGLLAFNGRVVVVGNRGRVEIDARQTMGKDAAILGMRLGNAGLEGQSRIHAALSAGFADGTLTPLVGREFPLAHAADAHIAVMSPGALGKIVLNI